MNRFIGMLLVVINAQCMDLLPPLQIQQLVENEPYPTPKLDDLVFVTDPRTRCIMSGEQYAQYLKQPQYQETRRYLKDIATCPEKKDLLTTVFRTHKDFSKTWVAHSMLLSAIEVGCGATTQRILELGVNSNRVSSLFTQFWQGELPLNFAIKKRNPEMVELLLKAGTNPDRFDEDGDTATALMIALESYFRNEDTENETRIISLLLEHKANPHASMLGSVRIILYDELPPEAIARHQKYEYWEHNRRLVYGKHVGASSSIELAKQLCLDNWVEEFNKCYK
ncbi:hypothetical protein BH09DEP1_BH09DEP1_3010 [soil metagenome]